MGSALVPAISCARSSPRRRTYRCDVKLSLPSPTESHAAYTMRLPSGDSASEVVEG